MDADCRAAYEADILFDIIAEAKRHCAWLSSSSQMQRRCRNDVETLVLGNRAFMIGKNQLYRATDEVSVLPLDKVQNCSIFNYSPWEV